MRQPSPISCLSAVGALGLACILCTGSASAQATAPAVALTGRMGNKALLVVNGGAPKALAAGEVYQGVKVLNVGAEQTVIEVAGHKQALVLGGAPVSLGGKGGDEGGMQIVLQAGSGGHFVAEGSINGRSTRFMVDTGATSVAMGADEARRLGIPYESGQRIYGNTANGVVQGFKVSLTSLRIQNVVVHNVEAAVLPQPMNAILLGNSFLTRFQMKRENDTLTLTRRF